jgi:hypothetical protein
LLEIPQYQSFNLKDTEMQSRNIPRCAVVMVCFGVSTTAFSMTVTDDLTGTPQSLQGLLNPGFQQTDLPLDSAATGRNQLPSLTVNVGDTFTGSVDFSGPVSIPAGVPGDTEVFLQLYENTGSSTDLDGYTASIQYFKNGVQVTPPASIGGTSSNACCGYVGFNVDLNSGNSAFTFDQLLYNVTITSISSTTGHTLVEGSSAPFLGFEAFNPAAVPLPASAWLLVSGLSGMGVLARQRRRPGHLDRGILTPSADH